MIDIGPLRPDDRADWERLARGYKTFYLTTVSPEEYEHAWQRLLDGTQVHGIGGRLDGTLVGITHYLFHPAVWSTDCCYLQDLFVDESARGHGVARALIEEVAKAARDRDAARLYWLTQDDNTRARALYDRVARFHGFIRYDYPLAP